MDKLGDRYVLLEQLGAGAMGVVWRARDELLHRDVAVKQMLLNDAPAQKTQEAVQRAMREGRIAARLHHPNAIAVYDVVLDHGKPCLVMEYLPSRTLSAILAERGPLPPVEAARIGSLAANALAAAHEAGIVHRDIKPGNVLIGRGGTVKITDFGISRALGDVAVTTTGMLSGTPAYLAPELARGSEPTSSSDVFSLGATIYAMTEGEPPFGRDLNEFGLLYKAARGEIRPPTRSGPLTPLLDRLLANEPEHRPTAAEAAEALNAIANGRQEPAGTVLPPPVTPPHGSAVVPSSEPSTMPPEPKPRKNRTPVVVASILAVLAIAGVAYAIFSILPGSQDRGGDAAGPSTGSSTPASQVQPTGSTGASTPPTTNPPTTTPSDPHPAAKWTNAQVVQFVKQYYAKLPHDLDGALESWNPGDAPDDYKRYWRGATKVVLKGDPEVFPGGSIFGVTAVLDVTDAETGQTAPSRYQLRISAEGDKLLITDEQPLT